MNSSDKRKVSTRNVERMPGSSGGVWDGGEGMSVTPGGSIRLNITSAIGDNSAWVTPARRAMFHRGRKQATPGLYSYKEAVSGSDRSNGSNSGNDEEDDPMEIWSTTHVENDRETMKEDHSQDKQSYSGGSSYLSAGGSYDNESGRKQFPQNKELGKVDKPKRGRGRQRTNNPAESTQIMWKWMERQTKEKLEEMKKKNRECKLVKSLHEKAKAQNKTYAQVFAEHTARQKEKEAKKAAKEAAQLRKESGKAERQKEKRKGDYKIIRKLIADATMKETLGKVPSSDEVSTNESSSTSKLQKISPTMMKKRIPTAISIHDSPAPPMPFDDPPALDPSQATTFVSPTVKSTSRSVPWTSRSDPAHFQVRPSKLLGSLQGPSSGSPCTFAPFRIVRLAKVGKFSSPAISVGDSISGLVENIDGYTVELQDDDMEPRDRSCEFHLDSSMDEAAYNSDMYLEPQHLENEEQGTGKRATCGMEGESMDYLDQHHFEVANVGNQEVTSTGVGEIDSTVEFELPDNDSTTTPIYAETRNDVVAKVIAQESKKTSASLCVALKKMFEATDNYSDILFTTKDGVSLPAHKFMLAARSPFFNSLFKAETKNEGFNGTIKLPDVGSEPMRVILKWMYTDELQEGLEICEVLEGAVQFQLGELIEALDKKMITFCNHDNMFRLHGIVLPNRNEMPNAFADISKMIKEYLSRLQLE